jgi:hypothetical protein
MSGLAAPKKFCPRVSTLCSSVNLGLGFLRLTVSFSIHSPKEPVFSTAGSSPPTPSTHPLQPSITTHKAPSFSLLTLHDHTIDLQRATWFRKAFDLRLLVSNLYHRSRTCIISRESPFLLHGHLLIRHHDDHRQRHQWCHDERATQLMAGETPNCSPFYRREPPGRSCSGRRKGLRSELRRPLSHYFCERCKTPSSSVSGANVYLTRFSSPTTASPQSRRSDLCENGPTKPSATSGLSSLQSWLHLKICRQTQTTFEWQISMLRYVKILCSWPCPEKGLRFTEQESLISEH